MQNKGFELSLGQTAHGSITSTTIADNDVPITLAPNTDYAVDIVVENSIVVVYINNVAALSCRIYKAQTTNWGIFTDHSDVTFKNLVATNP